MGNTYVRDELGTNEVVLDGENMCWLAAQLALGRVWRLGLIVKRTRGYGMDTPHC